MANYVPIQELADHFKVHLNTAWAWVHDGVIPEDTYIKVHRTYRFDLDRIDAAMLPKHEPKTEESNDE